MQFPSSSHKTHTLSRIACKPFAKCGQAGNMSIEPQSALTAGQSQGYEAALFHNHVVNPAHEGGEMSIHKTSSR